MWLVLAANWWMPMVQRLHKSSFEIQASLWTSRSWNIPGIEKSEVGSARGVDSVLQRSVGRDVVGRKDQGVIQ